MPLARPGKIKNSLTKPGKVKPIITRTVWIFARISLYSKQFLD